MQQMGNDESDSTNYLMPMNSELLLARFFARPQGLAAKPESVCQFFFFAYQVEDDEAPDGHTSRLPICQWEDERGNSDCDKALGRKSPHHA